MLLEQIRTELPSLAKDIQANIEDCEIRLTKLGGSRISIEEQRLFLSRISQSFQSLLKAAVDGSYGDSFFGEPRSTKATASASVLLFRILI